MATVITSECINCGACEPECPNTAIYQGGVEWELNGQTHPALSSDIFFIVPEKCTECVGFFDHEACAAVCPVDCCVPDPKIPETEDVLIERAKKLHPETAFGTEYPSRFRAGSGTATPAGAVATAPAAPAPTQTAAPAPAPSEAGPVSTLPSLGDWDIPIVCRECEGEYTVAFQYLRPGVVFYCPHCQASFVPTRTTYLELAAALEKFSARWERAFERFHSERRRQLTEFETRQSEELEAFEERMRAFTREGQKATGASRRRWFA